MANYLIWQIFAVTGNRNLNQGNDLLKQQNTLIQSFFCILHSESNAHFCFKNIDVNNLQQ